MRRRAPTNPSINQVAWTLDDRKVVAAITDNSIRVWDAETGALLHQLRGHTAQAHVLESHPFDHDIAMSAGECWVLRPSSNRHQLTTTASSLLSR